MDNQTQHQVQCPYCFGSIDPRATKCPHCISDLPILTIDKPNIPEMVFTFLGFLTVLFGGGYITGIATSALLKTGVFAPFANGVLAVFLGLGIYFASRQEGKWLLPILFVIGAVGGFLGSYFSDPNNVNIVFAIGSSLFGSLAGLSLGLARKQGGVENIQKRATSYIVSISLSASFALFVRSILFEYYLNKFTLYGETVQSFSTILSAISLRSVFITTSEGLVAGFLFALGILVAEKLLSEERSFVQLFKSLFVCSLGGGLYGAVTDGIKYNAYWSGIFEGPENVFINAFEGFKRDAIFCGFTALGALVVILLLHRLIRSKALRSLACSLGGGVGGVLGTYMVISNKIAFNSNTAIGEAFEGLLDTFLTTPNDTVYLGAGLVAAMITLFFSIFQLENLKKEGVERNVWNLIGGLLGGFLAGAVIGLLAALPKYSEPFVLTGAALVFGLIMSVYGLVLGVGLDFNINRPPPPAMAVPGLLTPTLQALPGADRPALSAEDNSQDASLS